MSSQSELGSQYEDCNLIAGSTECPDDINIQHGLRGRDAVLSVPFAGEAVKEVHQDKHEELRLISDKIEVPKEMLVVLCSRNL